MKLTYFIARYTTSISTLVAIVGAFFDSQITFCCMLRVDKTQQTTEPDNNSDVDYIMPRVCFYFKKIIILYRSSLITNIPLNKPSNCYYFCNKQLKQKLKIKIALSKGFLENKNI